MWFKVDDNYWSHPKVLLSGPDCRGVWVTAGSWCAQHLTDGRIPRPVLRRIIPLRPAKVDALAEELEAAGLWYLDADDWVFHDWPEYQPTKDVVFDARKQRRIRQQAWRDRRNQTTTSEDPTS